MSDRPQSGEPQTEASSGCAVDWSWLEGRTVRSVSSTLDQLVLTFTDGQTLTVRAALWKGQPFLAFDPWRPPSR